MYSKKDVFHVWVPKSVSIQNSPGLPVVQPEWEDGHFDDPALASGYLYLSGTYRVRAKWYEQSQARFSFLIRGG